MARYTKSEVAESLAILREAMPPGTVVYTTVERVSRSGMSRVISARTIRNNEPLHWSYHVARVLGWPESRRPDGVKVSGCGMDVGFHLVNALSYALHGTRTVGRWAKRADEKGHPYAPKPGNFCAGYSLTHRWL